MATMTHRHRLLRVPVLVLLLVTLMFLVSGGSARKSKKFRAPRILSESRELVVSQGKTGLLECKVKGRPRPSRRWFKDRVPAEVVNTRYSVNKKSRALRLFDVQLSDSGNYTCVARNRHGNDTITIQLIVALKPDVTITTKSPSQVSEGDPLTITCRSRAVPAPSFMWITAQNHRVTATDLQSLEKSTASRFRVEERQLEDEWSESVLDIGQISHVDHGVFVCYADNVAGSSKAEIDLDVLYEPKPARNYSLVETMYAYQSAEAIPLVPSCAVVGHPQPEVEWRSDGEVLNTSHCDLVVRPPMVHSFLCVVDESQAARYTCHASNRYGSVVIRHVDVRPLFPPGPVHIDLSRQHSNVLNIKVPVGLPDVPDPTYVMVSYVRGDTLTSSSGVGRNAAYETSADVDELGEATVLLPGLKEHTSYLVTVAARNDVGLGPDTHVTITTGKRVSPTDDLMMIAHNAISTEDNNNNNNNNTTTTGTGNTTDFNNNSSSSSIFSNYDKNNNNNTIGSNNSSNVEFKPYRPGAASRTGSKNGNSEGKNNVDGLDDEDDVIEEASAGSMVGRSSPLSGHVTLVYCLLVLVTWGSRTHSHPSLSWL